MELSAEFLLTAACCRWPPSHDREEAVRAAAGRPIDWSRFLRISQRQRVEGLVKDALERSGVRPPEEIGARLRTDAQNIARQNLAFAAESRRLRRLFEKAGLTFLFVKGATLDALAYGSIGIKKARDIDLLVAPENVADACAVLTQAGYVRTVPGPSVGPEEFSMWLAHCKETNWRHGQSGIIVELHSGLVENPALLSGIDAHSPSQSVEIAPGIELPTLRRDELFAYLCIHGATHAWSRMKWIADVAAFLKNADAAEIERLYRRSLDIGVGRCSAQALLLCERLFGLELPVGLRAELHADPVTAWLVRTALGTMTGRYGERELDDTVLGTLPIHLSHFLLGRGFSYKWGEARRKLRSPHDRASIALPGPLRLLYPVMAVPSWLWRRLRGPATH